MSSNAPSSADIRNLTVEDARRRMLARAGFLGAETVPLHDAAGRVLAEDVTAVRDQPPFDASAMDGWAVRAADLGGPPLKIVGESAAGHGYAETLQVGETVRIFTGAPVPAGADRVVIQEEAVRDGDLLTPNAGSNAPAYVRPRGGDFRGGDVLLHSSQALTPWRLALAAAAGRDALAVARRPRIAILTGGDEVVAPGGSPGPWQIFDSGSAGLLALARQWGAAARAYPLIGDDEDAIVSQVSEIAAPVSASVSEFYADIIVLMGGASVGDHDLAKPALARLGLRLDVETVKVRPGKPTWFGKLADGRLVLGLPGNPASAFVCAELFLRPLIEAMLGAAPGPVMEAATLAAPLPANGPREHWMRARLETDEDGASRVRAFPDQESSLVTVFAQADALLVRPAGAPAAEAGEVVSVLRLGRM
ncbi:molybdopterin molybdotransferase MoeA [Caulobacter segnis]|uniref:molybdopterin molybdotransferase MoeA n=1 Tax=Caulobacter segnis TaxID=88688 RepID=UPI00240FEE59|nr:gephyrin-like molybdotransferase Glp [Caulobacter segnis]MDG2519924.1 molybdopterin molybdotransferase MoeA [Caulobacter segnis]